MPIYEFGGKQPTVGDGTWIAPSANIIGDVTIGKGCYIGFGAIIRGDFGKIVIGNESLIEENVVIHGASQVTIGDRVIIGHMAMLHDTTIRDNALVGMMSMICDNSEIQDWAFVAERSLVMKKQVIPSKKIYGGSPAVEVGELQEKHFKGMEMGLAAYSELTKKYLESFKEIIK